MALVFRPILSLIVLPAAMALLACSGGAASPYPDTSSDSGAASNADAGADGAIDASSDGERPSEDAGARCNTLSQLGGPTKVIGSTYPSSTEGGTLADGTYVLVGEKVYSSPVGGGGEPIDGIASATMEVVGTKLHVVLTSATYGEQRATYTMTPYAKSFGLARTCLYVGNGDGAARMELVSLTGINYNATATQLTFVKPEDSVAFVEWNFVKR